MFWRHFVGVVSIFVLGVSGVTAQLALPSASDGDDVSIEADESIEWRQDMQVYLARGNATVRRGRLTLRAEVLIAHQRRDPDSQAVIYRIEGQQNVRINLSGHRGTSDNFVYDLDQQLLVLSGGELSLVMTSGETITAHDSMEYYRERNLFVARGQVTVDRSTDRLEAETILATLEEHNGQLRLTRLDGRGQVVVMRDGQGVAQSQSLIALVPEEVVILIGDVRLQNGDSQIVGELAEINHQSGVSRMLGFNGRVRALVSGDGDLGDLGGSTTSP